MANKELNAREWTELKDVSYKQTLRWLADPKIRKSKFPGAHQIQHRGRWFIPVDEQLRGLTQPLAVDEIVIREERKQAILAHFENLRAIAKRWSHELWLPPPWRWDITHLEHVFYIDTKKVDRGEGITGYKLPADLVDSEKSLGHIRHFEKGDVHWIVQDDGAITLKLPVEDKAAFGHLKAHTQESPALGLFAKWKKEGGTYIQFCSSLLARIEQDTKRAIRTKSGLSWWSIYHDAFCTKDTLLRCERCGTENPNAFICLICGGKFSQEEKIKLHIRDNHLKVDPKAWLLPQCQNCYLPLGWLRPLAKGYERAANHPQLSPIHIHGWGNIEESVEIERFEDMTQVHAVLRDKYRGHDLVETILEREKEVKQVETRLREELVSLSQQRVFLGKCPACPD